VDEPNKDGLTHILIGESDDNCPICNAIASGKDPVEVILSVLKEEEA
jgi:hypothetical protein